MSNCESNKNGCKNNKYDKDRHDKKEECCCKKEHHDKKEKCCCKESMKEALNLLKDPTLVSDAIFGGFTFIGDSYIVGSFLKRPVSDDNIWQLTAVFNGFDSCNCDLIKITPTDEIYYPIPLLAPPPPGAADIATVKLGLTVDRISLCDLEATVLKYTLNAGVTQLEFEADLIALLDKYHEKCKVKCDECCCNDGIFNALYSPFNTNHTVNLTGGWLAMKDLKVLGRLGNVVVLITPTDPPIGRLYFVCLDSVGFINV